MNIEEVYGKLACIKKENEMYVSYNNTLQKWI